MYLSIQNNHLNKFPLRDVEQLKRKSVLINIRQIFLPDIRYGQISGVRQDIRLNSNIIVIFLTKKMYLHLVFKKSAYRSLLYIDIILFVKTIFNFKQFFQPNIRPTGYPTNETVYLVGYRISGTTLIFSVFRVCQFASLLEKSLC